MTVRPMTQPRQDAAPAAPAPGLEHVGAIVLRWMMAHVIGDGGAEPQCAQCGGRVVESVCVDCGVPEVVT